MRSCLSFPHFLRFKDKSIIHTANPNHNNQFHYACQQWTTCCRHMTLYNVHITYIILSNCLTINLCSFQRFFQNPCVASQRICCSSQSFRWCFCSGENRIATMAGDGWNLLHWGLDAKMQGVCYRGGKPGLAGNKVAENGSGFSLMIVVVSWCIERNTILFNSVYFPWETWSNINIIISINCSFTSAVSDSRSNPFFADRPSCQRTANSGSWCNRQGDTPPGWNRKNLEMYSMIMYDQYVEG